MFSNMIEKYVYEAFSFCFELKAKMLELVEFFLQDKYSNLCLQQLIEGVSHTSKLNRKEELSDILCWSVPNSHYNGTLFILKFTWTVEGRTALKISTE